MLDVNKKLNDRLGIGVEDFTSENTSEFGTDIETLPDGDDLVVIDQLDKPKDVVENADLVEDYNKIRSNLSDLLESSKEMLVGIKNVAEESELPRAYEVATLLTKTISEINKDLLGIHKKMEEIRTMNSNVVHPETNNITNQAFFVGTSDEMQEMLMQRIDENSKNSAKQIIDQKYNEG
jgi:hypothetical protein